MVYIIAIVATIAGMMSAQPTLDTNALWFAATAHEACLIVADDMGLESSEAQQANCAFVAQQVGVGSQAIGVDEFVPTGWSPYHSSLMIGCVAYAAVKNLPMTVETENACAKFWQAQEWSLQDVLIDLTNEEYTQL